MRDEPFLNIHMTLPDKTSLGELILSAYENRITLRSYEIRRKGMKKARVRFGLLSTSLSVLMSRLN